MQNSFGNSTIVFLLFSFLLTYGLNQTGALRNIADIFITNPIARKNEKIFLGLYLLSMLLIGSFIAPTTLFILYFGIANEIFNILQLSKNDPLAKRIMIGTGLFASISCALTPIAHTFPLMALGYYETLTGSAINYITYFKFSLPVGLLIAGIAYLMLSIGLNNEPLFCVLQKHKWSKKSIASLIIFGLVVLCWILPGINDNFKILNTYSNIFPALIGCILMSCFDILDIKEGLTKGISWSALLLCSATLALGKVLTLDQFEIIPMITSIFENHLSLLLIIAFTVVLTNLISNIVTTTLAFNIFVPAIVASTTIAINPIMATIIIGFGASLAYALPSSIAHIALTASSGYANTKDMLKYGSILGIVSIIIMGVMGWILI